MSAIIKPFDAEGMIQKHRQNSMMLYEDMVELPCLRLGHSLWMYNAY